MAKLDKFAITAHPFGAINNAVCCGVDRRTDRAGNIDAFMIAAGSARRRAAAAKAA